MLAIEQEQRLRNTYPGLMSSMKPGSDFDSKIQLGLDFLARCGIDKDTAIDDGQIAAAVSLWADHRPIYSIDHELQLELIAQVERLEEIEQLPADLIRALPYPCISIEQRGMTLSLTNKDTGSKVSRIDLSGRFFVFIQPKCRMFDDDSLVVMAENGDHKVLLYFLPIKATIGDSVKALKSFWDRWSGRSDYDDELAAFELHVSLYIVQVILYLQAINADVQVRPAPAQKRKRSSLAKQPKPPKQYDVGVRLGNAMRRYKYERAADEHPNSNAGSHSTHRPHSRRGHWHHFWTGKRSEPENRKLVLQWVEPTFVGGKSTDATLFRLKKKTDEKGGK